MLTFPTFHNIHKLPAYIHNYMISNELKIQKAWQYIQTLQPDVLAWLFQVNEVR